LNYHYSAFRTQKLENFFTLLLPSGISNSLTHATFQKSLLNPLLPLGEGPGMRERIIALYSNYFEVKLNRDIEFSVGMRRYIWLV